MMTNAPSRDESAPNLTGATAAPATCSQKPEQRGLPVAMERMMGLETAARLLGSKARLAEAICCSPRSVHYKVEAGRGISNLDLNLAASALEERADELRAHAGKLRAVVLATAAAAAAGALSACVPSTDPARMACERHEPSWQTAECDSRTGSAR